MLAPVCLSELVKNYLFVSKLLSIGVYYCQLGRTILSLNISFCDAHRNEAIPRAETGINFEGDFLFNSWGLRKWSFPIWKKHERAPHLNTPVSTPDQFPYLIPRKKETKVSCINPRNYFFLPFCFVIKHDIISIIQVLDYVFVSISIFKDFQSIL